MPKRTSFPASALGAILLTLYAGLLLEAESQKLLFGLLIGACLGLALLKKFKLDEAFSQSVKDNPLCFGGLMTLGVIGLAVFFRSDPFVLFLMATVLANILACIGLNIQFGYAGVVNFAGASFFGLGCYTAALLGKQPGVPSWMIPLLGGFAASLVGTVLIVPVLKTKGHYAALVTIAFALLLKTFLEVNPAMGGPQGLKVAQLKLFGFAFGKDVALFGVKGSFYLPYLGVLLLLVVLGFVLARRLENSWIGLNMDAVRTDETVSATFGLNISRWKITSFTLGNFYCGVSGAVFAMVLGYIAPSSFSFGDSLILLSIVILGGLGSLWGAVAATCIVIILPEKFQSLQEYRFLLYSLLVIFILLFRPQGLLPRGLRDFAGLRGGAK